MANTDTLEKEVSIKEVREKLEEFCKKLGFNEIIYYSDNYEKTKDKAEDIRINVIAKKVKEISVEPKKDENVKNYRIDFTLKNEKNSKTYTLYI